MITFYFTKWDKTRFQLKETKKTLHMRLNVHVTCPSLFIHFYLSLTDWSVGFGFSLFILLSSKFVITKVDGNLRHEQTGRLALGDPTNGNRSKSNI